MCFTVIVKSSKCDNTIDAFFKGYYQDLSNQESDVLRGLDGHHFGGKTNSDVN